MLAISVQVARLTVWETLLAIIVQIARLTVFRKVLLAIMVQVPWLADFLGKPCRQ